MSVARDFIMSFHYLKTSKEVFSGLQIAAIDHSCSAGEEPEAPPVPLFCPFAMVLNDRQRQEHLRWAHSAAWLDALPALSLWWLRDPGCQQASKQLLPGETLPPWAGEQISILVKEQALGGARNQQCRTQDV